MLFWKRQAKLSGGQGKAATEGGPTIAAAAEQQEAAAGGDIEEGEGLQCGSGFRDQGEGEDAAMPLDGETAALEARVRVSVHDKDRSTASRMTCIRTIIDLPVCVCTYEQATAQAIERYEARCQAGQQALVTS